jgi:hypothetical protein
MNNPGYPPPRNLHIITSTGFRLRVQCRFEDVVIDKGVPTPRFLLLVDGIADWLANVTVDHIEGEIPPGTIVMFPQRGDTVDNTVKIISRSRRAGQRNIGLTREVDPTATRIEPK